MLNSTRLRNKIKCVVFLDRWGVGEEKKWKILNDFNSKNKAN